MLEANFELGFIKRAMEHGIKLADAKELYTNVRTPRYYKGQGKLPYELVGSKLVKKKNIFGESLRTGLEDRLADPDYPAEGVNNLVGILQEMQHRKTPG